MAKLTTNNSYHVAHSVIKSAPAQAYANHLRTFSAASLLFI